MLARHARGHAHIYMNNYTDEYKGTCASIGVMDQAVGQASEVHALSLIHI